MDFGRRDGGNSGSDAEPDAVADRDATPQNGRRDRKHAGDGGVGECGVQRD